MRRSIVTLALALGACGGGGSTPQTGAYVVDYLDAQDQATWKDCPCFWTDYGYTSSQACLADRTYGLTSSEAACIQHVGEAYPQWEAAAKCVADAALVRSGCYPTTCTTATFDACDAQFNQLVAACPTPCAGMSGTALTSCKAEWDRLSLEAGRCAGK